MKKAPNSGIQIFARGVGDADQQRGDERPAQAAEAADRDDDQEVDQVLERHSPGCIGRMSAPSAPPSAGEAAAEREGEREQPRAC